ncbi:MAG: hypothetical protein Q9227_004238 [Pyrenula ochraceoflavens]
MTPSRLSSEVCFGTITAVPVALLDDYTEFQSRLDAALSKVEFYQLNLAPNGVNVVLQSPEGEPLAMLNKEASAVISDLLSNTNARVSALFKRSHVLRTIPEKVRGRKKSILPIDINVYGNTNVKCTVGKQLSNACIYLQDPDTLEDGVIYDNPHILALPTPKLVSLASPGSMQTLTSPDRLNFVDNVKLIYDSLSRFLQLQSLEADFKVKTPLLPHQKEALCFMSQREFGPIPKDFSLWKPTTGNNQHSFFTHAITQATSHKLPNETQYGLLADEMGLGKTLSALANISLTSDQSRQYAEHFSEGEEEAKMRRNGTEIRSRATLIIVPTPELIDNWSREIDLYVETCSTHIIRQQSAKLSKAVMSLTGHFRWCLTGTPIQNSFDDLAALLSFLRPEEFDTTSKFRKNLLPNTKSNSDDPYKNIRLLLDAICLRRPMSILNIPRVEEKVIQLDFSQAEKDFYHRTKASMLRSIHQNVYRKSTACKNFGFFQMHLRLRRVCNHGTYEQSSEESEADGTFDQEQHLTLIQQDGDAKCVFCSTRIPECDTMKSIAKTTFTVCGHLLCFTCTDRYASIMEKLKHSGCPLRCPLCSSELGLDYFVNTVKLNRTQSQRPAKKLQPDGASTKVFRLVNDILDSRDDAKR